MSQTGVVSWSQTAASNATADSNVNWAEGMAPSQVNDSARAEMASVAKYRDDNSGTVISSGTSTAMTVTSNQNFSSLTVLNGQTIRVRFGATNGATPTLAVDGLTAKPIQIDATNAVAIGALRANAIHALTYDNSGGYFIVHHGHSLIEPGRISAYGGATVPQGWLLCNGAGYSRTNFADLFVAIGTTYGSSSGTTFQVPDCTGRVLAGRENSASRITTAISNINSTVLGAAGGNEQGTLPGATGFGSTGTGVAFSVVQPTIIVNWIIKT